ncbi:MAG: hypothetical protein ACI4F1_10275 [Bariatricus sp.]
MNVETMIYAYIAICVSMILFNIASVFVLEHKDRKMNQRSGDFEEKIKEEFERLEKGKTLSGEHLRYLSKKMQRISNLMAFDETMERLRKEKLEAVKDYLDAVCPIFVYLVMEYKKKSELQVAYFPYVIQKYGIIRNKSIPAINEMLLNLVKEPSVYCRENALKALYSTGDAECVMKAFWILDKSDLYHNPKLLTDGLLGFAGSHEALAAEIWKNYEQFSAEMKVTLLNYIRFDSGKFCGKMLELLADPNENDEVHYACIRYFAKYPYDAAYPFLIGFMKEDTDRAWQYAAIAATALAAYPGEETVEILKKSLGSPNWYVRLNASRSLEILGLDYVELIDVFEGKDRYASEILRYQFELRKAKEKEAEMI